MNPSPTINTRLLYIWLEIFDREVVYMICCLFSYLIRAPTLSLSLENFCKLKRRLCFFLITMVYPSVFIYVNFWTTDENICRFGLTTNPLSGVVRLFILLLISGIFLDWPSHLWRTTIPPFHDFHLLLHLGGNPLQTILYSMLLKNHCSLLRHWFNKRIPIIVDNNHYLQSFIKKILTTNYIIWYYSTTDAL